jgi:ATP-dependent DNA ligase
MNTTLYKKDALNRVKKWEISGIMKNNEFIIKNTTGIIGMKMTVFEKIVSKGKNIGKKNETSIEDQGKVVMNTMINKKRDEGYNEILKETSNPLPMLALEFSKRKHDIIYPAYVQPKIDGVRAIFNPSENYMYSRKGKIFPHLDFIINEIKQLGIKYILDGELYSEEMSFQDITGIVKKEKINEKDNLILGKIKYVVYDYIDKKTIFEDRLKNIENIKGKHVYFLKTYPVNKQEDVYKFHDTFVKKGYEGVMVRNKDSKYAINKRSKDLQKLKSFQTEEYEIVDGVSGTGTEKDCVIWTCKKTNNMIFSVRPIGSFESRKEMLKNKKHYIGKMLTVKFQEFTDGGIPRFPVGIAIRDYE